MDSSFFNYWLDIEDSEVDLEALEEVKMLDEKIPVSSEHSTMLTHIQLWIYEKYIFIGLRHWDVEGV